MIEEQIAALLAQAEPLRSLDDEDAERMGLPALVERINSLREQQAKDAHAGFLRAVLAPEPDPEAPAVIEKRRPGRPRKVDA